MKLTIAFSLFFSAIAFAGPADSRQFMTCAGADLNGMKVPVLVEAHVLNSKELEGMKIQYKKQVWVNEVNKVVGQPYNDNVITNHTMFKAKTDQDLSIVLPVNFRMLKATSAFLAQQKGDDITFTVLNCKLQ